MNNNQVREKIQEATEKFNDNLEKAHNSINDEDEPARCYKLSNYTSNMELERGKVIGLCQASDEQQGITQHDGKVKMTACEAVQKDMRAESRETRQKYEEECHW